MDKESELVGSLKKYLSKYKKKTVKLRELEAMVDGSMGVDEFLEGIHRLLEEGLLEPILSHGKNPFDLPYAFRVVKHGLTKDYYEQIRQKQVHVHPMIQLSGYFAMSEEVWKQDQEYIHRLHEYLKHKGIPESEAFSPERSYELVQDEKWIDEGGGRAFLERIRVYELLQVVPAAEPLKLAVNPGRIAASSHHLHLIVENKSAYAALSGCLADSPFTTLIYGSGKGFLASILQLEQQLNLPNHDHKLYYFGDLDREGLSIWYTLYQRRQTVPAVAFYQALLHQDYTYGKQYQKQNKLAEDAFMNYFSEKEQVKIRCMLEEGGYYPQEALQGEELRHLWRQTWDDL
ncbi:hypothetical protein J31TS4_11950 [Paenibacillus sp. J31TS4]|uniref:Wadjet anti-phage system protein JetD domain-containing protein n=1 Tax=Paenibacillus sp. J31TS4 TaxID=2807195 RepID=UPI001B190003|nr:Wadjet anti-phage system protein JetD domain-containing protein [Paenibacillus sp. J31TS4]GIP37915.1 hypothetical protein J31TS4_11950 [Paenibacillus sp. J31TS4]